MDIRRSIAAAIAAFGLLAGAGAADAQQTPMTGARNPQPVQLGDVSWQQAPQGFPQGVRMATLQGDPGRGSHLVYLFVPEGVRIPPSHTSGREDVILLQGRFIVGMPDTAGTALRPGGFFTLLGGVPQSGRCTSEGGCVLAISGRQAFRVSWMGAQPQSPTGQFPQGQFPSDTGRFPQQRYPQGQTYPQDPYPSQTYPQDTQQQPYPQQPQPYPQQQYPQRQPVPQPVDPDEREPDRSPSGGTYVPF